MATPRKEIRHDSRGDQTYMLDPASDLNYFFGIVEFTTDQETRAPDNKVNKVWDS